MKRRKRAATGFGVVLGVLFVGALFMNLNFHTVIVDGPSMQPTFKQDDRLLVSKAYWLVGPIKDKDIVVIQDPTSAGYIIKRVYRIGGETVDSGKLPDFRHLAEGPYVIPDSQVYVLGDNLLQSEDSRRFGPVDMSRVVGKVIVRS